MKQQNSKAVFLTLFSFIFILMFLLLISQPQQQQLNTLKCCNVFSHFTVGKWKFMNIYHSAIQSGTQTKTQKEWKKKMEADTNIYIFFWQSREHLGFSIHLKINCEHTETNVNLRSISNCIRSLRRHSLGIWGK